MRPNVQMGEVGALNIPGHTSTDYYAAQHFLTGSFCLIASRQSRMWVRSVCVALTLKAGVFVIH